jgi:hypothetical protein
VCVVCMRIEKNINLRSLFLFLLRFFDCDPSFWFLLLQSELSLHSKQLEKRMKQTLEEADMVRKRECMKIKKDYEQGAHSSSPVFSSSPS